MKSMEEYLNSLNDEEKAEYYAMTDQERDNIRELQEYAKIEWEKMRERNREIGRDAYKKRAEINRLNPYICSCGAKLQDRRPCDLKKHEATKKHRKL